MQTYILTAVLVLAALSVALNLYLVRKVQWVFRLSDRLKRSTDRKFRQLFRQMQILGALQQDLDFRESLPPAGGKAASADFLKVLADHVLHAKPEVVVECGSGLSTLVIARCLQLNGKGHVFSLEHMEQFGQQTRKELDRHGLGEWASVLDAPLDPYDFHGRKFYWYRVGALPASPIDLLIVDGPPARTGSSPRYPAGPVLFPRISPCGAVFIDDAGRPEELSVIADWRQEFPQLDFQTNIDDFEKGICIARTTEAPGRSDAEAMAADTSTPVSPVRQSG